MSNQWKENGASTARKRALHEGMRGAAQRRTGEVDTRIKYKEALYVLASV